MSRCSRAWPSSSPSSPSTSWATACATRWIQRSSSDDRHGSRPMSSASRFTHEEPRIHRWLRLGVLAAFAAGIGAFFALGGPHYLSLDAIREHRDALLAYTDAH